MTQSALARLVEDTAARAAQRAIEDHIDHAAYQMARELLADADYRAELVRLLRAAFQRAIADLERPADGEEDR